MVRNCSFRHSYSRFADLFVSLSLLHCFTLLLIYYPIGVFSMAVKKSASVKKSAAKKSAPVKKGGDKKMQFMEMIAAKKAAAKKPAKKVAKKGK